MSAGSTIDYGALAKEAGVVGVSDGSPQAQKPDYGALGKESGIVGISDRPPQAPGRNIDYGALAKESGILSMSPAPPKEYPITDEGRAAYHAKGQAAPDEIATPGGPTPGIQAPGPAKAPLPDELQSPNGLRRVKNIWTGKVTEEPPPVVVTDLLKPAPDDTKARSIAKGLLSVGYGLATPDSLTTLAAGGAAGDILRAAVNLPKVAAVINTLPQAARIAKAVDVAASAAVPATFTGMGVGNVIQTGQQRRAAQASGNTAAANQLAVEEVGNAIVALAGAYGVSRGAAETSAAYPGAEETPTARSPVTGKPIAPAEVGGVATPSAAETIASSQSLEQSGRNLAAGAWKDLRLGTTAKVYLQGFKGETITREPGPATVVTRKIGGKTITSVIGPDGNIIMSGLARDMTPWLQQNVTAFPEAPELEAAAVPLIRTPGGGGPTPEVAGIVRPIRPTEVAPEVAPSERPLEAQPTGTESPANLIPGTESSEVSVPPQVAALPVPPAPVSRDTEEAPASGVQPEPTSDILPSNEGEKQEVTAPKPLTPQSKSAAAPRPYEEIQRDIDAEEDRIEAAGGNLSGPMPPELKSLYNERDAAQKHEDTQLAAGLDERLAPVVPNEADRAKLVQQIGEFDKDPALRTAYDTESWRDIGRVANVALQHTMADSPSAWGKVSAVPAGTPDNPGIQLKLETAPGHPVPSIDQIQKAQAILDAAVGGKAPQIPSPTAKTPAWTADKIKANEQRIAEIERQLAEAKKSGSVPHEQLAAESGNNRQESAISGNNRQQAATVPIDQKAAQLWDAMDENQRTGVRFGMFPAEVMRAAEKEGFKSHDLSVALMEHAAGQKPTAAAQPKKPSAKSKLAEAVTRRREFYTPGNVIGYGRGGWDFDKVLDYKEEADGRWRVLVQATDKDGNPTPGERPRWHSTPPDKNSQIVGRAGGLAEPPKAPTNLGAKVTPQVPHGVQAPAPPVARAEEKPTIQEEAPGETRTGRGEGQSPLAEAPPENGGGAPAPRETGPERPVGNGPDEGLVRGSAAPGATAPGGNGENAGNRVPAGRRGRSRASEQPATSTSRDYRITAADHLGEGGQKEKARGNLEALRTLAKVLSESREATPEEQAKLVKYVGWGALSQAFDYYRKEWEGFREELEPVLSDVAKAIAPDASEADQTKLADQLFKDARSSTRNAHYTSPEVVAGMWKALERLGLKEDGAAVLEPAVGTGNFFGLMPAELLPARRTGVELDPLTGRIAQLLYPSANIQIKGFEKTALPNNYFDIAISNVPFGRYGVHDPTYKRNPGITASIHNYFFAKALDKVRPGGIVAFVTSAFTMDAKETGMRRYLQGKADLLGAIRLPGGKRGAFAQNAGTEVTTDIIFLQKRAPQAEPAGEKWADLANVQGSDENGKPVQISVNEYYAKHPEMMLGEMALQGTMYGPEKSKVLLGELTENALAQAVSKLPENVYHEFTPEESETFQANPLHELPNAGEIKDGAYGLKGDKIIIRRGGNYEVANVSAADATRIKAMMQVRDAVREVFRTQLSDVPEKEVEAARANLNKVYDGFVKKHGPVMSKENVKAFYGDPDAPLLASLEDYNREDNTAKKRSIFNQRTIEKYTPVTHVDKASEALAVSQAEHGRIDWMRMQELTGRTPEEMQGELAQDGLIYRNPDGQRWETADDYLSGDVRKKLQIAENAATTDREYLSNVEALKAVQPKDLTPSQINARLGASWIPREDIRDFVLHLLVPNSKDLSDWEREHYLEDIQVGHAGPLGTWSLRVGDRIKGLASNTNTWGHGPYRGDELVESGLNLKRPTVKTSVWVGPEPNHYKDVVDQTATVAVQEKQDKIQQEFRKWMWADADRAERLSRKYNDEFNNLRLREFNGSHLTFPGMARLGLRNQDLDPHQKNAIWRIIQNGNTLLGHVVGAGKTFEMIAAAMELKRMGLVKKPMFVVPNHLVEQWGGDFMRLYPSANVFVAGKDYFTTGNRQQAMSRIATGNYDAVIVAHRSFQFLPVSDATFTAFMEEQLHDINQALSEAEQAEADDSAHTRGRRRGKGKKSPTIKQLESAKARIEKQIEDRAKRETQDKTLSFEELGVDHLFVDEAHCFPYSAVVTTERGPMQVGEIVEKRLKPRVLSCNVLTGKLEWKPIIGWSKVPAFIPNVVVTHEHGSFTCTETHPIWTGKGYVEAGALQPDHHLRVLRPNETLQHGRQRGAGAALLLSDLPWRSAESEDCRNESLPAVRGGLYVQVVGQSEQRQAAILRESVRCALAELETGESGALQSMDFPASREGEPREEGSGFLGANENEQSHEESGFARKDEAITFGAYLSGARRSRDTDQAADIAHGGYRLQTRASHTNEAGTWKVSEPAHLLPSGSGACRLEDGYRGGRPHARPETVEVPGRAQNSGLERSRVVGIALQKRTGALRRFFSGGRDQAAYCIEVADNHNFFADGVLVSNCFKNLYYPTKMTRVAGLPNSQSDRAMDMFIKTQYLTGLHNGRRGVVFATGTPVLNSLAELFTMQRYLQLEHLKATGMQAFDSWVQNFAEPVTGLELAPEGSGYRQNTRMAKFINLPELLTAFRSVADIKTAEDLNLPRPAIKGGKPTIISVPSSEDLKHFVQHLAQRAEAIRSGKVKPDEDNMLAVVGEGRKAALDMRLVMPHLPDNPNSKVNIAIQRIFGTWKTGADKKLTQLVFLDLSTPRAAGAAKKTKGAPKAEEGEEDAVNGTTTEPVDAQTLSVYDDIRAKLIAMGVPKNEIAFIHDAKNDAAKQQLFDDVNAGRKRILLGSTEKMGAGTNVQRRLQVLHHLDAPWRPGDIEQRDGRGIRQGNENSEVELARYVTEDSFDAYMWQLLASKAKVVAQAMSGDLSVREIEDVGMMQMSAAEAMAAASGNPEVRERIGVEMEVRKLEALKEAHADAVRTARLEVKRLPDQIKAWKRDEKQLQDFIAKREGFPADQNPWEVAGAGPFENATDRNQALVKAADALTGEDGNKQIGTYKGFPIVAIGQGVGKFKEDGKDMTYPKSPYIEAAGMYAGDMRAIDVKNKDSWAVMTGEVRRVIDFRPDQTLKTTQDQIQKAEGRFKDLQSELDSTFEYDEKLAKLQSRLKELNDKLDIGKGDKQAAAMEGEEGEGAASEPKPLAALGRPAAKSGLSGIRYKPVYRNHVLYADADTVNMLADILTPNGKTTEYGGLMVPYSQATKLPSLVQKLRDNESAPIRAAWKLVSAPVREALNEALRDHHGLIIVRYQKGDALSAVKGTVRHETFHLAQQFLGRKSNSPILDSEIGKKAVANLTKVGYPSTDRGVMWAEIGAHLAEGPSGWKQMGLSHQEAKVLFDQYLDDWNEPEALDLKRVHPALNEVVHVARAKAAVLHPEERAKNPNVIQGEKGGKLQRGIRQDISSGGALGQIRGEPEAEREEVASAERGAIRAPILTDATAKAAKALGVDKFLEQDVIPKLQSASEGARALVRGLTEAIAPRIGVKPKYLDAAYKLKGDQEKAQFLLQAAVEHMQQVLGPKMDPAVIAAINDPTLPGNRANMKAFGLNPLQIAQVDFMDRLKTGEKQRTPELQNVADFLRKADDDLYNQVVKYKDSLPYLENHQRVLWKTIPGAPNEEQRQAGAGPRERSFFAGARRPLQGSRGYLKRHTLYDMSEGIQRGGVPVTYNPVEMFTLHHQDVMRFLTAQKFWETAGKLGARVFEKGPNPQAPEGFDALDDSIAKAYFRTQEGVLANTGQWFVEHGMARLMNNYLSRDLLRERGTALGSAGRLLMGTKNLYTSVELGLSGFHFTFITGEAAASRVGLSLVKFINRGLLQGDTKALGEAIADFGKGVTILPAAREAWKLGKSAISLIKNPDEFSQTPEGKALLRAAPNARAIMDEIFTAGAKLDVHHEYVRNAVNGFREAVKGGNYPGAVFRALPAGMEAVQVPLFKWYIPRIKVGVFLQEYSNQLAEKTASGYPFDRGKLARDVWDFVEDRFGEMNFRNLWWNNTFKTALQIAFRSPTWRLGTIRAGGKAVVRQLQEFQKAHQEGRAPRLDQHTGWLLGMALLTAIMSTIAMEALVHRRPKTIQDAIFPQFDPNDDRARLSAPTYAKGYYELSRDPLSYASGGTSGFLGKSIDVIRNRDYFGQRLWDDDDPAYQKLLKDLEHFAPQPISAESFERLNAQGRPVLGAVSSVLGITKAPNYASMTPLEQKMADYLQDHPRNAPTLPERSKIRGDIVNLIRRGDMKGAGKVADEAIRAGKITEDDAQRAFDAGQFTHLEADFKRLTLSQALEAWRYANPQEKQMLEPYLHDKYDNVIDKEPPQEVDRINRKLIQYGLMQAGPAAQHANQ